MENSRDISKNEVVNLTAENWRIELLGSTKPVMVLTESKDCSNCENWQKQWEELARAHPDFKFAISDAQTFGFPPERTPIVSTVVPGIGTSYLQELHIDVNDKEKSDSFWQARLDKTRKEMDEAQRVTELQKEQQKLWPAMTKYSLDEKPHSKEEQDAYQKEQQDLGQISEELVESKLAIISQLKGDIDLSIFDKPE